MALVDDVAQLAQYGPTVVSQVVGILGKIQPLLPTVKLVLDDPAMPQVVERIKILAAIEAARPKPPGTVVTASMPGAGAGVGLHQAILPLDALIYVRRNPWALPVGVAAFLGIFVGLGYMLGKRKATS